MALSLLILRRIVAAVALALLVSGVTLSATAVMANSSQVVRLPASSANRSAITDQQVMAIIAKNLALGIVSTRTTFSNGIYRTVVTLGNGATIVGCHDGLLQPIPCP